jgi:hypothetical protein
MLDVLTGSPAGCAVSMSTSGMRVGGARRRDEDVGSSARAISDSDKAATGNHPLRHLNMFGSMRHQTRTASGGGSGRFDACDETPGFSMPYLQPFGASAREQALNLRLGRLIGIRGKAGDATVRDAGLECQRQTAQARGKAVAVVSIAVIGMDEDRPGRRQRAATTLRPKRKQQTAVHTGHERSQTAAAGSRAGGHLEVRGMAVARGAMRAPNVIGDFLWHSADDDFHGGSRW